MIQLIYASKVDGDLSHNKITELLKAASSNNEHDNVSGLLVFSNDYFLQVLEGGRDVVNRTFQRICKNPLHKDIEILDFKAIHARIFDEHSMKYATQNHHNKEVYQRYFGVDEFNPYSLMRETAINFIVEISYITASLGIPPDDLSISDAV